MSRQGWNQAPQMMMTPDEVKELVPIIDIEKANVKKSYFGTFSFCLLLFIMTTQQCL
jgi:hypothetical protein